jgi:hypothetical protein
VNAKELHYHPQKATGPDVNSSYNYASVHLHYHSLESYLHDPNSNDAISSARQKDGAINTRFIAFRGSTDSLADSNTAVRLVGPECFTTPTTLTTLPAILGSERSSTKHVHLLKTNHCFIRARFNVGPPLWSSGQISWLQIGVVLCFLRGTN